MPFISGYMGRMVSDNELKMTKNGKETCSFTFANEEGWGDKKRSDYIRCISFGNIAKTIVNHFPKGTPLIIEGSWQNNPYRKDERGYDIPNWTFFVNKVIFLLKDKNNPAPKDNYVPYGEATTIGEVKKDSTESGDNFPYSEFAPLNIKDEDLPF